VYVWVFYYVCSIHNNLGMMYVEWHNIKINYNDQENVRAILSSLTLLNIKIIRSRSAGVSVTESLFVTLTEYFKKCSQLPGLGWNDKDICWLAIYQVQWKGTKCLPFTFLLYLTSGTEFIINDDIDGKHVKDSIN